ncbi:MAG: hypothetical protein ACRDLY_20295 [Thermoleophilaceae bacterium]
MQDTPFTRGEWVSGVQGVSYDALDNTGVRLGRAFVGGRNAGEHSRGCNYALRVPCVSGTGNITVDTGRLSEGSQPLVVQVEDAGGNVGSSVPLGVRVDNTAPGALPVTVQGGEGWRNRNDFDLAWDNPDEGDRAPIVAAHYRLCRSGGSACSTDRRAAPAIEGLADIAVPSPGVWQLLLWREDAATNQEPANASVPVALQYDPEPPQLGFEPSAAADPTLISVRVSDQVSGLAEGQIELSREGSGSWQSLATRQDGDLLTTRIDDAGLPPGTYLLRATARDYAGNQNSTSQRVDGQPMTVSIPLRIPTAMRAGAVQTRMVRERIRRHGKRRSVRRRRTTLTPTTRVRFGNHVRFEGQLENRDGQPIPDGEIHVFSRSGSMPEELVGIVRTDKRGRYAYRAVANSSRTLRFAYQGTPLILPAEREVTLLVRAASSFRAQPRRLLNGQVVTFVGRIRSLPVPQAGKLVELQVVLSGRWQTFRTALSGPDGRWRVRYRFRRSCGLIRYRFRAQLPAEAGFLFEAGRTRNLHVRVRGKPCR